MPDVDLDAIRQADAREWADNPNAAPVYAHRHYLLARLDEAEREVTSCAEHYSALERELIACAEREKTKAARLDEAERLLRESLSAVRNYAPELGYGELVREAQEFLDGDNRT